jgi:polyvinyl alcohol dehydrogenase (cytochrome)
MGLWKQFAAAGAVAAILGATSFAVGTIAQAQATDEAPHPGKLVYDATCAACHNTPEPSSRAAPVAALRKMSAQTLMAALTTGVMKPIGDGMDRRQLRDVVAYLAAPEGPTGTAWIDDARCPEGQRGVDLTGAPAQVGFGVDTDNTRRMTAARAGLSSKDAANLEVAWSFVFPRTSGLRGQGVVVGSTLFYPAGQAGYVLALDTKTGCVKWATPGGVRASLTYGRLGKDGPWGVVGGDGEGKLIAFEAATGKIAWKVDPRHDKSVPLSGTPLFAGDKIVVPISAIDVGNAMRPTFECCKAHGAVAVVNAADGKPVWTWHTMEDAKPLGRKNSQGVEMFGPSGAPIWSSPAVDLKKGVVYASTGENTSPPATNSSDAMVAIDLATGKQKWVFQALANDVWNMSCPMGSPTAGRRPPGPNCFFAAEGSVLRDHDFGGGPVIWRGRGGKNLILGGQKSGEVWALEPATGRKVWRVQFGEGTALGGVHWGIAADETRVYVPIADPNVPPEKNAAGLYAVDALSGKVLWSWRAAADCEGAGRQARVPSCAGKFGLSAPPLVVDGTVIAGGLDGRLYVFEAATGKLLATHDTAVPFTGVNKLAGAGGSIDAAGPFAGDGMLFVSSGYASFGQQPGNTLVAYRPKR